MPSIFAPQSAPTAHRRGRELSAGQTITEVPQATTRDFWSDNWPYVLFGGGSLIFIAYVWYVLHSHWPKE